MGKHAHGGCDARAMSARMIQPLVTSLAKGYRHPIQGHGQSPKVVMAFR